MHFKLLIIFLGLMATGSAISYHDVLKEEWNAYKLEYDKQYKALEDRYHFHIFRERKYKIAKHNQKFAAGEVSYEMEVNEFADISQQEFQAASASNNTFYIQKSAISHYDVLQEEWNAYKLAFKKMYKKRQDRLHFKIFCERKYKIAKHNQKFAAGEVSYEMGLNEFADISLQRPQAISRYNDAALSDDRIAFIPQPNIILESVDWRNKGAVTKVKNQGLKCNSCWTFSCTGAIEGQHFLKSGKLVSLSEQNLIDCCNKYKNYGCNGGLVANGFQCVIGIGGIDTAISYKYKGRNEKCHFNRQTIETKIQSFVELPTGDEEQLKRAVAKIGPISVGIDIYQESFRLYKSGIYDEPQCSNITINHDVLVIGYGTDAKTNLDYWLVKNSYGPKWGERGYIRMIRNKNNQCGIATRASYPVL